MISPYDGDHLREECGVFGIFAAEGAAALTVLGLHALQHRGQEAAGIVTHNGSFNYHKALGHVGDNFNSADVVEKLHGKQAIGHVRYSTAGGNKLNNIQPMLAELGFGGFALGHNGNLTNALTLRKKLISEGCIFQSTMDTEVIIHLVARSRAAKAHEKLIDALKQVEGAYSIVAMDSDSIIGVRDPLGVRPLVLGRLNESYILASETCALDIIGAKYEREVEPGEMVIINAKGVSSLKPFSPAPRKFCIFEYIYFARPDSVMEGRHVYEARKSIGRELARESGVKADIVVPVPDSGVAAAIGYSEGAGAPFELGIIRNHYVGRTFIEPTDQVRHLGVKLKHNANGYLLKGKKVVLVDDSIVRGTTSKKIVSMVRDAGATEVHMRIASPPTTHSCFYGVDTPERSKLLASRMSVTQMAEFIGVDSLAFISLDGLYRAVGEKGREPGGVYCDACFTGDYPIKITDAVACA